MQLLVVVALMSLVAGIPVALLVWHDALPTGRQHRRGVRWALRGLLGLFVVAPVVIVLLLAFAEPRVCTALGGSWIEFTDACRNEIGGNNINDDDSFSWGRFFDPVDEDRRS